MNKGKLITILISIILVIGIIYIAHRTTLGEDGFLTQASNVEIEYNKKEILNVLKSAINEKYLESYNLTKEDTTKKIDDFYNSNIAINYLIEKEYIEYYYYKDIKDDVYQYIEENITDETKKRDDIFYINVNNAIKDINQYGKGKKLVDDDINKSDVFILEKKPDNENIYIINYYNLNNEKEEIGELNLKEPI
ncbi:MAG: hypothetical protein ACI4UE_05605 [Candidatus Scatovivens sp.]